MQKWMKWTVLEALSKTIVRLLQKVLGNATTTLGGVSAVIALTGATQLLMGLAGLVLKRRECTSNLKGKIGALAFGLGAVFCNLCALFAFQYGGDVVVITFLTTLSMIPGALLDRFWFKKHLSTRQWLGLGVGLIAGYVILGCPSLQEALAFPLWVWLGLGNALGLVYNQFIVQTIKDIHPYAKNAWGGASTLIASALLLYGGGQSSVIPHHASTSFVFASLAIGFITFFMWSFSLFAYKDGAFISAKKLVMNASYLSMTAVCAVLLFGEAITAYKVAGFLIYLASLSLIDQESWKFVVGILCRSRSRALSK